MDKTSAPLPAILLPEVEQALSGFSDPIGFEGRAAGRVELPGGLPQLGFLAPLETEPWRAFGFSVCVCVYVLGRASMVLYICHFLPRETARKVSLVFTSIRTLEEFILINWSCRGCTLNKRCSAVIHSSGVQFKYCIRSSGAICVCFSPNNTWLYTLSRKHHGAQVLQYLLSVISHQNFRILACSPSQCIKYV